MGRYIRDVEVNQPLDVVSMIMEDYVYHNHFLRTDWNGEMVFFVEDGYGRERYIKWSYAGGVFHVEAWLKNKFGGMTDLDGFGGGASRREFRKNIDALVDTIKRQSAAEISSGHVGSDPLHHTRDYKTEHRKQSVPPASGNNANGGAANNSAGGGVANQPALFLGVLALVFSSIPVVGLVLGSAGLKKARKGGENQKAGKLVCIIAIIVSVIMIATNLIGTLTVQW